MLNFDKKNIVRIEIIIFRYEYNWNNLWKYVFRLVK